MTCAYAPSAVRLRANSDIYASSWSFFRAVTGPPGVAPDYPGSGRSPRASGPLELDGPTGALVAEATAAGLPRVERPREWRGLIEAFLTRHGL